MYLSNQKYFLSERFSGIFQQLKFPIIESFARIFLIKMIYPIGVRIYHAQYNPVCGDLVKFSAQMAKGEE
jgi:hypothetical protein